MNQEDLLKTLEGLHTVETVAEALNITKQSALNILTKLKKQQYVTVQGGGKTKRLYKITLIKQRPGSPGMFDIINKYSPNFQVNPWYDHQVHGKYGPEEALIDALQTDNFRLILASLCLFNHIKNWPKLYKLAREKNCWQKVGALYDVAHLFLKVRKMPQKYQHLKKEKMWVQITQLKKINFPEVSKKWKVYIPFNEKDIKEIL